MSSTSPNAGNEENRRRLLTALGVLSIFSMLKLPFPRSRPRRGNISCGPRQPAQTMKLLGQDGRLMEVDVANIKVLKNKISDRELKDWISRSS